MPLSSTGLRYVIVAVDYITKFPLAKAIPTKDANNIVEFIENDIISMFGVPEIIVSDQGSEFKNHNLKKYM